MDARFGRRSMLALAAAGALGLALPSCSSEAKGDEPEELTEYGYDPGVAEPGTLEAPTRLAKVPPAASVRAEWLPPVWRRSRQPAKAKRRRPAPTGRPAPTTPTFDPKSQTTPPTTHAMVAKSPSV
jgi:hypothetical protein